MKSNKTREKILDASLKLFNEKKASNVSTVQISAAMKISPGNLYYYYANKEEVIRCIFQERMTEGLDELFATSEKIKTAADMLDYIEASLKHILKYKFFYTEMQTLFINDRELIGLYSEVRKRIVDVLDRLYRSWNEAGKIIDVPDVSRTIAIDNCIALSHQIIASYDVAAVLGKSFEDFIGIAWMHMAAFLKPFFTESAKAEVDEELTRRGFAEENYENLKAVII